MYVTVQLNDDYSYLFIENKGQLMDLIYDHSLHCHLDVFQLDFVFHSGVRLLKK